MTPKELLNIGTILMEWSLKHGEYDMAHYLYTEMNIGIPTKLTYKLPEQRVFTSTTSFLNNNGSKGGNKELNNLLRLFPNSKYIRLSEWNRAWGYKFHI